MHSVLEATTDPSSPPAPRPDPQRRLSSEARTVWTLRALGSCATAGVVLGLALAATPGLPGAVQALVVAAAVVAALVAVVAVPQLRWRRWRWEVRPAEIDLRHGAVTEVRTLVPMARVQHVEVRRTLLARSLGTADLVVHTAAGTTTIPLLPEASAVEVRDRIAGLASVPDEL